MAWRIEFDNTRHPVAITFRGWNNTYLFRRFYHTLRTRYFQNAKERLQRSNGAINIDSRSVSCGLFYIQSNIGWNCFAWRRDLLCVYCFRDTPEI